MIGIATFIERIGMRGTGLSTWQAIFCLFPTITQWSTELSASSQFTDEETGSGGVSGLPRVITLLLSGRASI